jgi:gamma-glutamyltranspeptidase/glutathione hydrolase
VGSVVAAERPLASAAVAGRASTSTAALASAATPPPTSSSVAELPLTRLAAFAGGARATSSEHGLVVAVEARAASAGAAILERGGNAVDAAIATLLALSVTHPSAASLGGGGFALVHAVGAATVAVDFREVAPQGLTRAGFDRMLALHARGSAAVGVPGTVAGVAMLHARWGRLPFAQLVQPALELAKGGHVVGRWQAQVLAWSYAALRHDPAARALFGPQKPWAAGQHVVQPDLAWTLERLASVGASDFYTGEIASRLVRALAAGGHSQADLASYRAVLREPLRFSYAGYVLETMPPPSAGGVALLGTLTLLQQRGSAGAADGADEVHWFLEASRRGQAERRRSVRDPDTLSASQNAALRVRWLDPQFWARPPLDPRRATPSLLLEPAVAPAPEAEHTTHLSVVDAAGMAVSLTTTLSASFGAKLVAPGTGIVLNNAVASFSSGGENQPAPGRRTVSSMAPTLVLDGERVLAVLGTPGGDSIPSTLAQIVRNLVDYRLPLDGAVDRARWHQAFLPDLARHEDAASISPALRAELEARGHRLQVLRGPMGDANCIVLEGARAFGYADPRERGSVRVAASHR